MIKRNKSTTAMLLALIVIMSLTIVNRLSVQGNQEIKTLKSEINQDNIHVTILNEEGKKIKVDFDNYMGYPAIMKSRTYVPLRIISEYMGYDVNWDQENWKVSINNQENNVELIVGENHAIVNGRKVSLDEVSDGISKNTKSFIFEDRTYVPLRFISEAFGAKVDYSRDKEHSYIVITMNKKVDNPVSDKWIEPSFYVDVYNNNGNFAYNLLLLNQKALTKSGNDISVKVKWNKSDWDEYLHGYKYSVLEQKHYKFDNRNKGMYNEKEFVPNGTTRVSIFDLPIYADYRHSDNKPFKNIKGKTLKLNVEVTQNGATKTYPFNYVVK